MSLLIDALNATTQSSYATDVKDIVMQKVALLFFFERYGKLDIKGGVDIRQPLFFKRLNSMWYRGLTKFNTDEIATEDYAVVQWKQFGVPVVISGYNRMRNAGPAQVVDLVELKIEEAKATALEQVNVGYWSDGITPSADLPDGMQAVISPSSAYGGHAVTDFGTFDQGERSGTNRWASPNIDSQPATLDNFQLLFGMTSFGTQGTPSVAFAPQKVFNKFWSQAVGLQRLVDSEIAQLGFSNIQVNGSVKIIVDNYAPAASLWLVNFDLFKIVIAPEEDFQQTDWIEFPDANGVVSKNLTSTNMICGNRAAQGSMTNITGL